MSTQNTSELFIGIDVSKNLLDLYVHPTLEQKSFSNNREGIRELVEFARSLNPFLIVLEATEGYEMAVMSVLTANQQPVVVAK